jgi:hypothetical protein
MSLENTTPTGVEPLEQLLHRRIESRTWGRVRHLRLALRPGGVSVQGSCPSYYVKQLVLAAVREVLPSTPVDLDVEVLDNFARASVGPRGAREEGRNRHEAPVLETCSRPDDVPKPRRAANGPFAGGAPRPQASPAPLSLSSV